MLDAEVETVETLDPQACSKGVFDFANIVGWSSDRKGPRNFPNCGWCFLEVAALPWSGHWGERDLLLVPSIVWGKAATHHHPTSKARSVLPARAVPRVLSFASAVELGIFTPSWEKSVPLIN